ncbi:hypothetical protein MCEMIH16_02016 [Caulobacteraceae bacterium]
MTNQTDLALIRELSTELAIALEHYEDDPARWQPEAVAAVRAGADTLKAGGRPLPVPIYLVLARADAGGDAVAFDRAALEAAGIIEADPDA